MLADELLVGVNGGILLGADEEHVFEEVRKPGVAFRFMEAAAGNDQGRGRFVGLGIGNQQDAQTIRQGDRSVAARIVRARRQSGAVVGCVRISTRNWFVRGRLTRAGCHQGQEGGERQTTGERAPAESRRAWLRPASKQGWGHEYLGPSKSGLC